MKNNPFVSQTFKTVWLKHFHASKPSKNFKFISNVSFVKSRYLPYYLNVGKKLTSGVSFNLTDLKRNAYKNKVFSICDIPNYHKVEAPEEKSNLGFKKIFQYDGYLIKVSDFDNLDNYMKTIFKSNTRSKFRRNVNRLEACFNVEYVMYYGDMSKSEYDFVFSEFYNLLEKRYRDKNEPCGELNPVLWNYYTELVHKLILEKKGSLFVIYCDKKPVGITFSYHFDSVLIEALTVFDIDFYRFNIGHTTTLKMLDWSFKNGVSLFDFTHGEFDYKKRWSHTTYKIHRYFFYDKKSIASNLLVSTIVASQHLRRWLRDKHVIKKINLFRHKFKTAFNKEKDIAVKPYTVELFDKKNETAEGLVNLDFFDEEYSSQRKAIYDYLYLNPVPAKDFKLFFRNGKNNDFIAKGSINTLKISLMKNRNKITSKN